MSAPSLTYAATAAFASTFPVTINATATPATGSNPPDRPCVKVGYPSRRKRDPWLSLRLGWGQEACTHLWSSQAGGSGNPKPVHSASICDRGRPCHLEHRTSHAVPRSVLFLFPSVQTSTSVATLAPAPMANVKTNLAALSASRASPAIAARGAGPVVVRAVQAPCGGRASWE